MNDCGRQSGGSHMSKFFRILVPLFLSGAILASCNSGHKDSNESPLAEAPATPQPVPVTPAQPPLKVNEKSQQDKPTVVMISIDGFRADYLQKFNPPNLNAMAATGVVAKGLIPSFPTLTFPNHITLVTGRYPGNHGIVGNKFFDKKRSEYYEMGQPSANDGTWYKSDAIWTIAEKNGMISATYFWVGSEAKIAGIDPTYFEKYDHQMPNAKRIDKVIEWLKLPKENRPHFITLYFAEVDDMGHQFGPDAKETRTAVLGLDSEIGRLKAFVDKSFSDVQFVVVSDHGMMDIKETIDLSSAKNLMNMKDSGRGAVVYFYGKDQQQIEAAYNELLVLQKNNPGKFNFYRASELKPEWHLNDVDRRGDLIVVGEPGVYLGFTRDPQKPFGTSTKATHGWDAANTPELNGLFIANGSLIKKSKVINAFSNVNVFSLVTNILQLNMVNATDSDPSVLQPILVQ